VNAPIGKLYGAFTFLESKPFNGLFISALQRFNIQALKNDA
jgi:hypothetical protein